MQTERRFLDSEGRLQLWPSKQRDKLLVLAYLAAKFNFDATYTEAEVNELLKKWHNFNDWPMLRRELYARGFLDRNIDGVELSLKTNTNSPTYALTGPPHRARC